MTRESNLTRRHARYPRNSTSSYQCQASLSGLGLSASHKRSHGIHECKRKGNSAPGKSLLSQVAESPFEYNLPRSNSYVIEIGWNIYTMAWYNHWAFYTELAYRGIYPGMHMVMAHLIQPQSTCCFFNLALFVILMQHAGATTLYGMQTCDAPCR